MEESPEQVKEELPLSIGEISTEIRTQQPTAEVIVPLRQAQQENNKAKKEESKLHEEGPQPSKEIASAAPPSTSTQPLKGFF